MDPKQPPHPEDEDERRDETGQPPLPPDPDRPTDDVWDGDTLTEPGAGSSGS